MDGDLASLFQELAEVQTQQVKVLLTDSNVIDLLQYLSESKLLEPLIAVGTDRTFVTKARLHETLEQMVREKGRVHLNELRVLSGVDAVYVDEFCTKFEHTHKNSARLLRGELITDAYLDTLAAQIGSQLRQEGSLPMMGLSKRHGLPFQLIQSAVQRNLGKGQRIDGSLMEGTLITTAFENLHRARVRGMLRAATAPLNVKAAIKERGANMLPELAMRQVRKMATDGKQVDGALTGSHENVIFTPGFFLRRQQQQVSDFYEQNRYVPHSLIASLNVKQDPAEYLQQLFPKGRSLSSVFVDETCAVPLQAALDEAIERNGWTRAASHLPDVLTKADVADLVTGVLKESKEFSGLVFLGGAYIATKSFLQDVTAALSPSCVALAATKGAHYAEKAALQPVNEPVATVREPVEEKILSKKELRKLKASKSKGKNKKNQQDNVKETVAKSAPVLQKNNSLSLKDMESLLKRLDLATDGKRDLSVCGDGDEGAEDVISLLWAAEALVPLLSKTFSEAFEVALASHRPGLGSGVPAKDRRKRTDAALSHLQTSLERLEVFRRAIGAVLEGKYPIKPALEAEKETLAEELHKYLVKTVGVSCVDALVRCELQLADQLQPEEKDGALDLEGFQATLDAPKNMTDAARVELCSTMGQATSDSLLKLCAAVKSCKCTADELKAMLLDSFKIAKLKVKDPDSKTVKAMVSALRRPLLDSLTASSDPSAVLQLSVLLFLQRTSNFIVHCPKRLVASIVEVVLSSCMVSDSLTLVRALLTAGETADEALVQQVKEIGLSPNPHINK